MPSMVIWLIVLNMLEGKHGDVDHHLQFLPCVPVGVVTRYCLPPRTVVRLSGAFPIYSYNACLLQQALCKYVSMALFEGVNSWLSSLLPFPTPSASFPFCLPHTLHSVNYLQTSIRGWISTRPAELHIYRVCRFFFAAVDIFANTTLPPNWNVCLVPLLLLKTD